MKQKSIRVLGIVTMTLAFAAATTATHAGAAINARAYAVGSFELSLDGVGAAWVSSVDGGTMISEAVAESGARGAFAKKRPSAPKFDPLEVTLVPSKPWIDWVNGSLAGTERPKNGTLSGLDINSKEQSRRTMSNLRLSEVSIPELNAADGKRAFELFLKLVGDAATDGKAGGAQGAVPSMKRSLSMTGNFRVTIPGLDTSRVVKVTEIVAKANGAPTPTKGELRFPPASTRAEVANFSVVLSDVGTDAWKNWHQSFVVGGKNGDADEKTMTVEMLTPQGAVTFRAKLEGVGILALAPVQDRGEAPRQLQADLYAESIRFEDGGK